MTFKLQNSAELIKKIGSIGRRAAALRSDIQLVLVSTIGHAQMHGDITLTNRLLDAVGSGVRKQAIVAYAEIYGPFEWDGKEKTLKHKKRNDLPEFNEDRFNTLMEIPWQDAVKEKIKSVYDGLEAINRIISTIRAKKKKHDDLSPDSDLVLAELEAAVERIAEVKAEAKKKNKHQENKKHSEVEAKNIQAA